MSFVEEEALRVAEAQLDAGQGVPHEKVQLWLTKLARGRRISAAARSREGEQQSLDKAREEVRVAVAYYQAYGADHGDFADLMPAYETELGLDDAPV